MGFQLLPARQGHRAGADVVDRGPAARRRGHAIQGPALAQIDGARIGGGIGEGGSGAALGITPAEHRLEERPLGFHILPGRDDTPRGRTARGEARLTGKGLQVDGARNRRGHRLDEASGLLERPCRWDRRHGGKRDPGCDLDGGGLRRLEPGHLHRLRGAPVRRPDTQGGGRGRASTRSCGRQRRAVPRGQSGGWRTVPSQREQARPTRSAGETSRRTARRRPSSEGHGCAAGNGGDGGDRWTRRRSCGLYSDTRTLPARPSKDLTKLMQEPREGHVDRPCRFREPSTSMPPIQREVG